MQVTVHRGGGPLGALIGGGASLFSCLVSVAAVIGSLGCVAGILVIVFGAMRTSEPYQVGLAAAQNHPEVIAALGEPVEPGMFVTGSIETSGDSGIASLNVPLRGPDGRGTLYINARKSGGEWSYSRLQVEIKDTDQVINIGL